MRTSWSLSIVLGGVAGGEDEVGRLPRPALADELHKRHAFEDSAQRQNAGANGSGHSPDWIYPK